MPIDKHVVDKFAIRELLDSYSHAVMTRDAEKWAATWAPDASWLFKGEEIKGRDSIVSTWKRAMESYSFVGFYSFLVQTQLHAEQADIVVNTLEYVVPKSGEPCWQHGSYRDKLVRCEGGFLFHTRDFTVVRRHE